MKEVKQIKLFVSCPGDISDELDSIKLVVQDINDTIGEYSSYVIKILNWKTDTYTQIGSDAQEVINEQIDSKYDILLGLIWSRIGTPTKRDKSGTVEEINRALSNNDKEQLIYFKTTSIDITKIDVNQIGKINDFKKDLKEKGVLFHQFPTTDDFESLLKVQLPKLINDKIINRKEVIEKPKEESIIPVIINDKYSHITSLIKEVENFDKETIQIDIFNSVDEASSHLNLVTSSLHSMTESMSDWTKNMNLRTEELNRTNNIKDKRLRESRQKTIINLLAVELDDFNNRIRNQLPVFADNYKKVGTSYSKILLIAKSYNDKEVEELKESAQGLLENSDYSLDSLANLLKSMMDLPPLNFKFNKAKREAEITIKDLIVETMEGSKLLNEALFN